MDIKPVTNQQNFEGSIILKNQISRQQRVLFEKHRPVIEKQIENMPFDLFVEQSKGKKTVKLSTSVEGADSFAVNKKTQGFVEAAGLAISDGMKKSGYLEKLQKSNEILGFAKMEMINVLEGNFKEAREAHKEMAKRAVKDFDIYKQVTNFRITELPPQVGKVLFVNSLKYKAYCAFSSKTPEEKQLIQMNKEYLKKMKAEKKEIKPQIIQFSKYYQ